MHAVGDAGVVQALHDQSGGGVEMKVQHAVSIKGAEWIQLN